MERRDDLGHVVAAAEGGVDGDDLAAADVGDGTRLGGAVPFDGHGDVDVDHRSHAGERQVLRGRPHDRAPGGALERRDRGAEPTATEQEAMTGGDSRIDR